MGKSRVDIFRRPLSKAKAGTTPTSIFRRNNPPPLACSQSSEGGVIVSSIPAAPLAAATGDQQWPPHQHALSSASEGTATTNTAQQEQQQQELNRVDHLPTGTGTATTSSSASGEDPTSSPPNSSPQRNNKASRSSSKSPLKNKQPPSYYKIELNNNANANNGDTTTSSSYPMVHLTSGDDSSVQLTPDHNKLLQLADKTTSVSVSEGMSPYRSSVVKLRQQLIRASPIVEHERIELEQRHEADHHYHAATATATSVSSNNVYHQEESEARWTISDKGNIIIIPPSPSRVSMNHQHVVPEYNNHPTKKSSIKSKKGGMDYGDNDSSRSSYSMPPLLVKASHSSDDSFVSTNSLENSNNNGQHQKKHPDLVSGGSHNTNSSTGVSSSHPSDMLESPPRMNRSFITQSLFQDHSTSSRETGSMRSNSSQEGCSLGKTRPGAAGRSQQQQQRSTSNSSSTQGQYTHFNKQGSNSCGRGGGPTKMNNGGCGSYSRPFDLLSQLLDVFSLTGPCCQAQCGAGA